MQESSPSSHRHQHQYDHNLERMKQSWAIYLLSSSWLFFLFTLVGFTNDISEQINEFLLNQLGYVNKWSTHFGPEWFLHLNKDISALGGASVLSCFLIIIAGYYIVKKQRKRLNKFLLVVIGGGIVMQVLKIIFAETLPYEPIEILSTSISNYPSGHAMMATIFYLTLGVFITRWQRNKKTRRFTLIVVSSVVFLVAVSRILSGIHTFTEVLAGWSAGMVWLSSCWMLERYIKKNRSVV